MPGKLFVVDDKTYYAGTVIEASGESAVADIRIEIPCDTTACVIPAQRVSPIVIEDRTLLVDEKPIVQMGDVTACSAPWIASQMLTTYKV